jgi:hypothetical protein
MSQGPRHATSTIAHLSSHHFWFALKDEQKAAAALQKVDARAGGASDGSPDGVPAQLAKQERSR